MLLAGQYADAKAARREAARQITGQRRGANPDRQRAGRSQGLREAPSMRSRMRLSLTRIARRHTRNSARRKCSRATWWPLKRPSARRSKSTRNPPLALSSLANFVWSKGDVERGRAAAQAGGRRRPQERHRQPCNGDVLSGQEQGRRSRAVPEDRRGEFPPDPEPKFALAEYYLRLATLQTTRERL